ncbi:MAG: hypothetical protein ABL871_04295 [Terricaulis sp.]
MAKTKAAPKAKAKAKAPAAAPKAKAKVVAKTRPATRTLRMDLRHDNETTEVFWSIPGRPPKGKTPKEGEEGFAWSGYFVSSPVIDGLGETIRKHLQALQGIDWDLNNQAASADAYGPILAQLISAGQELHGAIFRGDQGDELSKPRADKFAAWFTKHVLNAPVGAWRIEVIHVKFSKLITPWALACVPMSKTAVATLDPSNPDDYGNFWGARFKLAVRGSARDMKEEREGRDGRDFRLACVLELDDFAVTHIESSGPPGEDMRLRHHIGWDRAGYTALAKRHRSNDLFWYISLKADVGAFVLGKEEISPSALEDNRSLVSDTDRVVLMMLDGDAVIRGDRGPDWLKKALEIGRSGLIAVEADIRNPQVHHYGWRVLKHVLKSQEPLLDAMAYARRECWPLGLLYGIYCSPVHAAAAPPPEPTIKMVDKWLETVRSIELKNAENPS